MAQRKYKPKPGSCPRCEALKNRAPDSQILDTVWQEPATSAIRHQGDRKFGHWWRVMYPPTAPEFSMDRLCTELRVVAKEPVA